MLLHFRAFKTRFFRDILVIGDRIKQGVRLSTFLKPLPSVKVRNVYVFIERKTIKL